MFIKLLLPLILSMSVAVSAITTKTSTFSESLEITVLTELVEGLSKAENQYDLLDSLPALEAQVELLGSNLRIQKLILNKNVILNPTLDFIYFAHAPPHIS